MLESKENPAAPVEEISHVIIDEAHERNLDTDVILCLIRDVLRRFPKLRLILMSASMNTGLWEKHFRDFAPLHVECPGKLFPVSQLFLEETLYLMKLPPSHAVFEHNYPIDCNAACKMPPDYKGKNLVIDYSLVVNIVDFIHLRCIPGAILIFLPGVPEMVLLENELSKSSASFNAGQLEVLRLHARLNPNEQNKALLPASSGCRKVILSTNIAETSVTIEDVGFVIDSGLEKVDSFDVLLGASCLQIQWIPQTSVVQRKGRAGRRSPGTCFHLFSREKEKTFNAHATPEILRVSLESLCLKVTKLPAVSSRSIKEFLANEMPEAPLEVAVDGAVRILKLMGALDRDGRVTDLGKLLSELPVEPRLGKMLLTAISLRCLDPVLLIVSCLNQDRFAVPSSSDTSMKQAVNTLKDQLAAGKSSDHMVMLQAVRRFLNNGNPDQELFVSKSAMDEVMKLRGKLRQQLEGMGFHAPSTNEVNWTLIIASVLSGLYPQLAVFKYKNLFTTLNGTDASVDTNSVMALKPSKTDQLMMYSEMKRIQRGTILCGNTTVTPVLIALFCGLTLDEAAEVDAIGLDGKELLTLKFHGDENHQFFVNSQLLSLKKEWESLAARYISNTGYAASTYDGKLLQMILDVVHQQEESSARMSSEAGTTFSAQHNKSSVPPPLKKRRQE